ncbi:MAG TPA: hypothetical protein VNF46_05300 [Gammaproteobacteria bacterium]|nr:hypothetical protein [Gammaproteobacteria bacterium]
MHSNIVYIVLTIFVMITFFVMVGANAIGAIRAFLQPPLTLIGEIVVLIGSAGIAYWLGMLFYRFIQ